MHLQREMLKDQGFVVDIIIDIIIITTSHCFSTLIHCEGSVK